MRLVVFLGDYSPHAHVFPILARRTTGDVYLFLDHRMPTAERLRTVIETYDTYDVEYIERVIADPYPGTCAEGFHRFTDDLPATDVATCSQCGHVEQLPHMVRGAPTVLAYQ